MLSYFIFISFFVVQLWSFSSCITLNDRYYVVKPTFDQFKITKDGLYEIWAAGASGGGDDNAPGGKGGIAAGIQNFKVNDLIYLSIGGIGSPARSDCGGAGGGGATVVYTPASANENRNNLLLIGPGGGGSGMNQRPNEPDYLDLTAAKPGSCDKCILENNTCAEAAPGKDISTYMYQTTINLTYNPSMNYNYTSGCVGGYGGGGQGGALKDITNKTTSGGGGGGGGEPGGAVGRKGDAKSCTAGGPGKAHCKMTYCDITRPNDVADGYFLIKLHERYKELPLRDRTNNERPGQAKGDGSKGSQTSVNFFVILFTLITFEMLFKLY